LYIDKTHEIILLHKQ